MADVENVSNDSFINVLPKNSNVNLKHYLNKSYLYFEDYKVC
jgi:hypothetical protein